MGPASARRRSLPLRHAPIDTVLYVSVYSTYIYLHHAGDEKGEDGGDQGRGRLPQEDWGVSYHRSLRAPVRQRWGVPWCLLCSTECLLRFFLWRFITSAKQNCSFVLSLLISSNASGVKRVVLLPLEQSRS